MVAEAIPFKGDGPGLTQVGRRKPAAGALSQKASGLGDRENPFTLSSRSGARLRVERRPFYPCKPSPNVASKRFPEKSMGFSTIKATTSHFVLEAGQQACIGHGTVELSGDLSISTGVEFALAGYDIVHVVGLNAVQWQAGEFGDQRSQIRGVQDRNVGQGGFWHEIDCIDRIICREKGRFKSRDRPQLCGAGLFGPPQIPRQERLMIAKAHDEKRLAGERPREFLLEGREVPLTEELAVYVFIHLRRVALGAERLSFVATQ